MHPKLMGQYYWKDDKIHTNRQRANEIKNVIGTNYGSMKMRSYMRMGREGGLGRSLLQPLERTSNPKI